MLYTGPAGLVAHECIVDLRPITKATGVSIDDVAKRLIDYGFHAPTMSFPVAGTLMIEPTESEDLAELDRFCDAMIAIRARDREGRARVSGARTTTRCATPRTRRPRWAASGSTPTAARRPSSRPVSRAADKYWPPVRRIDGAFGDRNLVCSCPPLDEYDELSARRGRRVGAGAEISPGRPLCLRAVRAGQAAVITLAAASAGGAGR